MRFKDVFSIMGPCMVGPSSSHTAGAARLGKTARHVLGDQPEEAELLLYGSFATTYRGHGTDLALIGGLLNYDTDDVRIKDAYDRAKMAGMNVGIHPSQKAGLHPNTVTLKLRCGEERVVVTGSSIGGGNIEITGVNGFDVKFTAMYPTLLIFHADRRGILAEITELFMHADVNIGYMEVDRKSRSGDALTVIEIDELLHNEVVDHIAKLPDVHKVRVIQLTSEGGPS